jgi:hypothetical protein
VLESQTVGRGPRVADSDSYSKGALANSTENLNMPVNGRSLMVLAFARAWGPRAAAGTNGPGLQVPIRCVPSRRSESAWHPHQCQCTLSGRLLVRKLDYGAVLQIDR